MNALSPIECDAVQASQGVAPADDGRGCRWPLWPLSSRPTHQFCGARRWPLTRWLYCEQHAKQAARLPAKGAKAGVEPEDEEAQA